MKNKKLRKFLFHQGRRRVEAVRKQIAKALDSREGRIKLANEMFAPIREVLLMGFFSPRPIKEKDIKNENDEIIAKMHKEVVDRPWHYV